MNRNSGEDIYKKIKRDVPLYKYTTFKIGGPADYFIEIEDEDEFTNAILWAIKKNIKYFVLGKGANILVNDNGYNGLVIYTGKYNKISSSKGDVIAQCGVLIDDLVDYALDNSLSGIEFLAGMPGTVGGAIYMNARAYGGEISSIVKESKVLIVDKKARKIEKVLIQKGKMDFSYKKSVFQKGNIFLLEARFGLKVGNTDEIMEKVSRIRALRKEKGEYLFPSAGCIFKNDYSVGKSSGKIIDECGLKEARIGDAEVFENHANFIVNKGNATANDVYKLIKLIEKEVKRKTGIKLEREIILLGFDN